MASLNPVPVIRRHLWYLRPPNVVFALFSDSVEDAVKQEITEKLPTLPVPEALLHDIVTVTEKTRLPDMLNETSWLIF